MLISFTNANDETFDIQNNYILQPDWDLGSAPVDHQMAKAPYQDGETYIDTIFEPNNPTISFAVIGNTRQNIFDRCLTVQKHFNPKLGLGTLKWIQDDGTTYYLDCIPLKPIFPSGEGRSHNHQIVIIQFIAPNPFWYDPTQLEQIMVGFSGGFSLPFSFPFTNGEVVNPVMQNLTTGEDITITKTIDDGDVLIINTAFGEKSVMILSGGEYTNAFEFVDPDSVFWKLAPGDNTLKYTVSSEGANAECHLYSGV